MNNKTPDFWKTIRKNVRLTRQTPPLNTFSSEGKIPLSMTQEQLWRIEQLKKENSTLHLGGVIRIKDDLNFTALEKTINKIVQRHEILRTHFTTSENIISQKILSTFQVDLQQVDLQHLTANQLEKEVQKIIKETRNKPFNLVDNYLWRCQLIQLAQEDFILNFVAHHLIWDAWSSNIFTYEFNTLYQAFSNNKSYFLPKLSIQYADYTQWQRNWLKEEKLSELKNYWQKQFEGNINSLVLPIDRPLTPMLSYKGAKETITLSASLTKAIKILAQEEGVSLFITLFTVFNLLLNRYTEQKKLLVATTILGRDKRELKRLIGYFNNILIIKSSISQNITFKELLSKISNNHSKNLDNQYFPFHSLVKLNNLVGLSLTRAMFSFVNLPTKNKKITSLNITPLENENNTADFDITLLLREKEQQIVGNLIYKIDLFQNQTIVEFLNNFQTLLEIVANNPDILINNLPKFLYNSNCIIDYEGNKVNLEAIKNTVNEHSKVKNSYITVSDNSQQDKQLIAYIVSERQNIPSVIELKQYLQKKSPQYLIPTAFVFLESFPLTTEGKIDRKALLEIDLEAIRKQKYIVPSNKVETQLVQIWQEVFNLDKIGISDNFFSLGGNSILATQLVTKIHNQLKINIPLKVVFERNTVKEIADYIINQFKEDKSCVVTINSQGKKTPLYFINSTSVAYDLNKCLDNEQPFYSLNIFSLTTRIKKPFEELTITDFAEYIIDDLLKYQSEESYNLLGFCQDGALTLEIAKQLQQKGKKINLLGLIDVVLNRKGQKFTLVQRIEMLSKFKLVYLKPRIQKYWNQTKTKVHIQPRLNNKNININDLVSKKVQLDRLLYQYYRQAIRRYQVEVYEGKIISFRTLEWKHKNYSQLEKITNNNLDVINIESTHSFLFKQPYIQLFARELNNYLT